MVSDIIKKSLLRLICPVKRPNLFLIKLILICVIINLFDYRYVQISNYQHFQDYTYTL